MRARVSADQQAAIDRRLALLRAELAGEPPPPDADGGAGAAAALPGAEDHPGAQDDAGARVLPGPTEWWSDHTRVASRSAPAAPPAPTPVPAPVPASEADAAEEPAPRIPMPGRHAAPTRRPRPSSWLPRLPDGLVDRLPARTPAPATVAVVALVAALAIALTCWYLVGARPEALPVTRPAGAEVAAGGAAVGEPLASGAAAPGAAGGTEPGADPAASPSAAGATVTVDVAGRVRSPGIAVLPAGSRVVDAIEAAGGARRGVDLSSLNLARVLVDGEQILVGVAPAAPVAAPGAGASSGSASPQPGQVLDLNTADAAALEALPEVGPVTAQAIVDFRTQNGPFTSVDQLLDVDGIGEATLAQIAPWVRV